MVGPLALPATAHQTPATASFVPHERRETTQAFCFSEVCHTKGRRAGVCRTSRSWLAERRFPGEIESCSWDVRHRGQTQQLSVATIAEVAFCPIKRRSNVTKAFHVNPQIRDAMHVGSIMRFELRRTTLQPWQPQVLRLHQRTAQLSISRPETAKCRCLLFRHCRQGKTNGSTGMRGGTRRLGDKGGRSGRDACLILKETRNGNSEGGEGHHVQVHEDGSRQAAIYTESSRGASCRVWKRLWFPIGSRRVDGTGRGDGGRGVEGRGSSKFSKKKKKTKTDRAPARKHE